MKIINLTQHKATSEQIAAGVVDLSENARNFLVERLTFAQIPTKQELEDRAADIAEMAAMYNMGGDDDEIYPT
ncbi:MAG: hypothetical protein LAT63_17475, partial [Marinobacter sp.]|nr:hypothetical protein [Marinobacter sp.]